MFNDSNLAQQWMMPKGTHEVYPWWVEVGFGVWVGKYELPYPRIRIQNEHKHRAFGDKSSPGTNTEARLLNGRQPKSMSAVLRDEGSVAGPGSLTQRQPTTDRQQPTTTNNQQPTISDQRRTTTTHYPPPTTHEPPITAAAATATTTAF